GARDRPDARCPGLRVRRVGAKGAGGGLLLIGRGRGGAFGGEIRGVRDELPVRRPAARRFGGLHGSGKRLPLAPVLSGRNQRLRGGSFLPPVLGMEPVQRGTPVGSASRCPDRALEGNAS